MSCLTKLFHHTGTTSATDIGPASNGVLHSITFDFIPGSTDTITLRDGGSGGTVICILKGQSAAGQPPRDGSIPFKGVKLNGQLNVALSNSGINATIEMSELPS